jgi:hypothetical protein
LTLHYQTVDDQAKFPYDANLILLFFSYPWRSHMTRRTPEQMKAELQRLIRCVEAAGEAEGQIEEIEHELAQATSTLFLLVSQRFVSEDEDTEPTEWEHEVMGISKETPFNRFTMRFQVVNNSVQIRVYDMDDLLLTVDLDPNERVKLKTPCFVDPGETQFILSAFKTASEAEACLLVLEARQNDVNTPVLN